MLLLNNKLKLRLIKRQKPRLPRIKLKLSKPRRKLRVKSQLLKKK
jgi:hypothetical protein